MNNISTINGYLNGYLDFLKDHSYEEVIDNNITKITLPFLDSLDDCTEIYIIKKENNEFILTDNGETLSTLSFNGVSIKGYAREGIFNRIINSYGVRREQESLFINANISDLFLKKHLLIQCICKVNDMYMLNRSNVKNIFLEEVKRYFDEKDIRYVQDHRLTGISGLIANYDFAIPKSKQTPLTLVKTLNDLTKDRAKSTIFDWNDTKSACDNNTRLIVVYNDEDNKPKDDTIAALKSYNIENSPWSKKENLSKYLSA